MNWRDMTPEEIKAYWHRTTVRTFVFVYLALIALGLVGWATGNIVAGMLALITVLWIGYCFV